MADEPEEPTKEPTPEPIEQPTTKPAGQGGLSVAQIVPPRVRTWVYLAAVVLALVAILAAEVVPIWAPGLEDQIRETANRLTAFVAVVTGSLGAAYRPSRL